MAAILKQGEPLAVMQHDDIDRWLEENGIAKDDVEIRLTGRELANIRAAAGQSIMQAMHGAGVPQSALIGLLCDVAQYGAYANAVSVVALGEHGNAGQKAYIKATNALHGAQAFMAALDAEEGGIKIPALKKGVDTMLAELKTVLDAYTQAKGNSA